MFTNRIGLFTALAFSMAACAGPPSQSAGGGDSAAAAESSKPGRVIASFAGKSFTEGDLEAELARLNKRSRKALSDPDRRKQFVENHVLSQLIFEEGRSRGHDKEQEILRQLSDLERRLVIQKVMQEHQSAPVTDDEVKEYYDSNPAEFSSDRVKASHILVKEEDLANEIRAKLVDDPDSFASLAEEHSIDKSNAKKGGDLGFFTRGRMVKEFEDAAFGLTADGQISDVIKTRFGYHIVKRTAREDGSLKPFDDVKNQIRIRLINDKRRTQTQEFLDELKQKSGYSLDEDVLASVVIDEDAEGEAEDKSDSHADHGH